MPRLLNEYGAMTQDLANNMESSGFNSAVDKLIKEYGDTQCKSPCFV